VTFYLNWIERGQYSDRKAQSLLTTSMPIGPFDHFVRPILVRILGFAKPSPCVPTIGGFTKKGHLETFLRNAPPSNSPRLDELVHPVFPLPYRQWMRLIYHLCFESKREERSVRTLVVAMSSLRIKRPPRVSSESCRSVSQSASDAAINIVGLQLRA